MTKKVVDWCKFMNYLLNNIGDSQRLGINDDEILETTKEHLIDFLVEHDAL